MLCWECLDIASRGRGATPTTIQHQSGHGNIATHSATHPATLPVLPHIQQHCPCCHTSSNTVRAATHPATLPVLPHIQQHCPCCHTSSNTARAATHPATLPVQPHIQQHCLTYREVALESLGPTVCCVATDLTWVAHVEAMEFVEPVRDGFPVPSQGKVLGVVRNTIFIFITGLHPFPLPLGF